MQKELEQKRKEYLLEAENVVRIREEAFNQELLKLQTELEHQKRIQVIYPRQRIVRSDHCQIRSDQQIIILVILI